MSNTIDSFERQHRALAAHAARRQDTSEMYRHMEAVQAAMAALADGQRDATALWAQYPCDITAPPVVSDPKTGADVKSAKSDGTDDALFVQDDNGPDEPDRLELLDGLYGNDNNGDNQP